MPTADDPPHGFPDQLVWALHRRPRPEREELIVAAQASQKEVQTVGMTIAEALKAEGMAEGEAEGRLAEAREGLLALLEEKFGPVPETIRQRIRASADLTRLRAAHRRVLHLGTLEEFDL